MSIRLCSRFHLVAALTIVIVAGRILIEPSSSPLLSLPSSSNVTWTIHANRPTIKISPDLYGIFFEEINHAGVGGLYAEQINNANFETLTADYAPWFMHQTSSATVLISLNQETPLNAYQPTSLQVVSTINRIDDSGTSDNVTLRISNPGFWGINIIGIHSFDIAVWIKSSTITTVTFLIQSNDPSSLKTYGNVSVGGITSSWRKITAQITGLNADDPMAIFTVQWSTTTHTDQINFDVFSVMPSIGWRGLKYIRPDLGDMIAALKPSFFRFPGGAYVDGVQIANRFNWARSIGPIEMRTGHWVHYNYYSEDGLGLFEYLSFNEKLIDIYGRTPKTIWVINCGVAGDYSVPPSNIDGWIQDTLDSIEFAQGDVATKYGAIRAQMGHPAPFTIDYIGIGNEDCTRKYYNTSYQRYYNVLKRVYPDIGVISNCVRPGIDLPVDYWDYHIYATADYLANQNVFDTMPRSGGLIFNSEFASNHGVDIRGNLHSALGEAAWLMGVERNSDLVIMAAYAPLLVNDHDRRWSPDAICFVSDQSFGIPSYWNQFMFANSFAGIIKGTAMALDYTLINTTSPSTIRTAIAMGAIQMSNANTVLVHKIVNFGAIPVIMTINIVGLPSNATLLPTLDVVYLTGNATSENDFETPNRIAPITTEMKISTTTFDLLVTPFTLFIIRAYANV